MVLLLLPLGCGDREPGAIDAGTVCNGPAVCEDGALKACNGGFVGPVIDNCMKEGACSRGRCITPACAAAEGDRTSFAGCLFYTVQADNVDTDVAAPTSYLVTNPGDEPATVALQQADGNGMWIPPAPTKVAPRTTARLSYAGLQVEKTMHTGFGLRITSNRPVTVAQIESDDVNHTALSSAGTMLLPAQSLGTHYRVMTYPQARTAAIAALAGSETGAGRVLIVGTRADKETKVTMRLPDHSSAVIMGSLPSLAPDSMYDGIKLAEDEVFQAWSGNEGDDLSGTEIVSDYPVAVFSGNVTTTYGQQADRINSPDMAHEQMPPVFAWSTKYVAASLPPQAATCDTLLGEAGASIWRVLAADDRTDVDIVGPGGSIGSAQLKAGQVLELIRTGDFVVTASGGPILMTQGIDCEPSLSLAISGDQMLEDLTFAVLPFFDQTVAIARPQGATVTLDGFAIVDSLFSPAGAGFEVARVALPTCAPSDVVCTHRLQGRFGMTLRGMDLVASYALTAPAWQGCADADTFCPN